jgi:hypothetical protein
MPVFIHTHMTTNQKCAILYFASLIIEIASTYYITAVSEKDAIRMMFWAFIAPFLSLPFLAYQIEAKSWSERIRMALAHGLGYASGAAVVVQLF